MQLLTISEIKSQYPNEWVLIGNPELSDPEINGSIVSKLVRGIVLYASKDKRELAYKAKELRENVAMTACIFTGEVSKHKLFLL